jgi:CRP/FNR family transcriptional regulator, cyclic AMP receptor protein
MTNGDLQSIGVFSGLSAGELARVAGVARPMHFEAGHVIVSEGEFSFGFYALVSGAADVVVHGEKVRRLGAGDVLGEIGVVPQQGHRWTRRRSATVIATEPTEAISIDGDEFRRLAGEIPALAVAVDALAATHRDEP